MKNRQFEYLEENGRKTEGNVVAPVRDREAQGQVARQLPALGRFRDAPRVLDQP